MSQTIAYAQRRRWAMCFCAVIWMIWSVRNNKIFRGTDQNFQEVLNQIMILVEKWEEEWKLRKEYSKDVRHFREEGLTNGFFGHLTNREYQCLVPQCAMQEKGTKVILIYSACGKLGHRRTRCTKGNDAASHGTQDSLGTTASLTEVYMFTPKLNSSLQYWLLNVHLFGVNE
ncbi:hypothetical protein PIB30_068756 [Stylosanthes scabra]|uniref:Uncharacterized protein n=1 Tax=Stylosanthes scabra TaxID=79078 RepID=A0ABU6WL88_9FABA|nr:hypothetical protein [Stylosanthes scabra]